MGSGGFVSSSQRVKINRTMRSDLVIVDCGKFRDHMPTERQLSALYLFRVARDKSRAGAQSGEKAKLSENQNDLSLSARLAAQTRANTRLFFPLALSQILKAAKSGRRGNRADRT